MRDRSFSECSARSNVRQTEVMPHFCVPTPEPLAMASLVDYNELRITGQKLCSCRRECPYPVYSSLSSPPSKRSISAAVRVKPRFLARSSIDSAHSTLTTVYFPNTYCSECCSNESQTGL